MDALLTPSHEGEMGGSVDLSAELWRFGGGAVTDKVKLPLLPISKPFFSVLCSSGMLQILN